MKHGTILNAGIPAHGYLGVNFGTQVFSFKAKDLLYAAWHTHNTSLRAHIRCLIKEQIFSNVTIRMAMSLRRVDMSNMGCLKKRATRLKGPCKPLSP